MRENRHNVNELQRESESVVTPPEPLFEPSHAIKCELAADVLRATGKLRLQVSGWSMFPGVRPGDTLWIERLPYDSVREGDIVLFGRDQRFFVHRVAKKSAASVVTRGDAMAQADAPIGADEVLGKVRFVMRNGKLTEPGRSPKIAERAVGAVMRRSELAARVVARVHSMRRETK